MKRIGMIVFYAIGTLAILYLALYAYVRLTGNTLQPGDPIHIFRKPGAPDYSSAPPRCCRLGGKLTPVPWLTCTGEGRSCST
jgi:hypothetical protein